MIGRGISLNILVDADACPVKDIIIKVARAHKIPVTMYIDNTHILNDDYCKVITVDKARDSVDIALLNATRKGDIVITQDYGVAAMALGRGAGAINQNGLIYSKDNIDRLLFERHLGQRVRRGGGRTAGPKKRTKEDNLQFEMVFRELVNTYNKAL